MSESETKHDTGAEDTLSREDRVALGVELIAHIESDEMELPEIMERIGTVSTVASTQRRILNAAEERGLLERNRDEKATEREKQQTVALRGQNRVRKRDVERREGEYNCQRCGASLTTGHFITLNEHEHGPFGPECVRKVLGRA